MIKLFILPPMMQFLLILIGLITILFWKRVGAIIVSIGFFSLVLISTPLFSSYLAEIIELKFEPLKNQKKGLQDIEFIVVLGGGSYKSPMEFKGNALSNASIQRVLHASKIKKGLDKDVKIIVSSGNAKGGQTEAWLMRDLLKKLGHENIILEASSRNTWENALYTHKKLEAFGLKDAAIILVTHAMHMPRSMKSFEKAGFKKVLPAPTYFKSSMDCNCSSSWVPRLSAISTSRDFFYELFASFYYSYKYGTELIF